MSNTNFNIENNYQYYFKNFLGAWSFPDGDETLTISNVDEREMFDANTGGTKRNMCIEFSEKDLPFVLNATNAGTIAEVVGSDRPADWIGKKIIVGTGRVKAFGKVTEAIRVRNEKPKTAKHERRASERQLERIDELIEDGTITNLDAMLEHFRTKKVSELTAEQAREIIEKKTGEIIE